MLGKEWIGILQRRMQEPSGKIDYFIYQGTIQVCLSYYYINYYINMFPSSCYEYNIKLLICLYPTS